jgi:hypothetical protein
LQPAVETRSGVPQLAPVGGTARQEPNTEKV